jgi:predicted nucleotidyltransferase component of viral defense system
MIPPNEIRTKAREYQVPLTVIERDYAQNWLLVYLPEMAFKGGTSIRKIYIENYRFSDDLDFTLLEDITFNVLKNEIRDAVNHARYATGINFLDEIKSEIVENGYVFSVYFRILRTAGAPLKIKLDITKKENEIIITPIQKKRLIHIYSDNLQKQIPVYSLAEIFAEKSRALFERTRPRDLYDVWYLSKIHNVDVSILKNKCEFKKIELNIDLLRSRKTKFIKAWENSLKHQVKDLPPANEVFEKVMVFLQSSF